MNTVIKVFGCGGGGSNAVNRMIEQGLTGAEFIAANTDHQALKSSRATRLIKLGDKTTRGLGAGGFPCVGTKAAEESANQIAQAVRGADMVFIAAGMGGGTGTGAAPVVARLAREAGAVTVGVVTKPFDFEGKRRMQNAQGGIDQLKKYCDSLIVVSNERLLELIDRKTPIEQAFFTADDMLRQSIEGLTELVMRPGLINVDFANVKELMQLNGGTVFSIGSATGSNKACEAIQAAFNNPLLEENALQEAQGLLVHFKGSHELTLVEINQAMAEVHSFLREEVQIVMGATLDEMMGDRVQVTLVATGVGGYVSEELIPVVETMPALETKGEVAMPTLTAEAATPAPAPVYQPTLATTLFASVSAPAPLNQPAALTEPYAQWEMSAHQIASSPRRDDLDVPTFLRRRIALKAN